MSIIKSTRLGFTDGLVNLAELEPQNQSAETAKQDQAVDQAARATDAKILMTDRDPPIGNPDDGIPLGIDDIGEIAPPAPPAPSEDQPAGNSGGQDDGGSGNPSEGDGS